MSEAVVLMLGAAVAALMSLGLIRLGHREGGVAFAVAWWCLFASGFANRLSVDHAWVAPFVPIFGTLFAAFLVHGALRMSGRGDAYLRPLWLAALGIVVVRVTAHSIVEEAQSQILAALVITAAAALSTVLLLEPVGRRANLFDRAVAAGMPTVIAASTYYTWLKYTGQPVTPAMYLWLLVGNGVCTMQVAAYIDRTTRSMQALRSEASRSREARESAEERYRQLTDQASDMITELDFDGRILYANPAHETILGLKPQNLVGQLIDYIFPRDDPADTTRRREKLQDAVAHRRHVKARDNQGEVCYLECDIARVRLDETEERLVVTSRDVTQRVLEDQQRDAGQQELRSLVEAHTLALDTSLERLRRSERLASMGTLAAGIAHQINNPIGSIRMGAEYALTFAEDSSDKARDEALDALRQIVEHAKRCGKIVSSMLQFARNEPTPKQEEDLAEIIQRVCDQSETFARRNTASIDTSSVVGPLVVFGSAIELEQAILNVIQNACESSEGAVRVKVKGACHLGAITIVVQDNGRGMTPEEIERAMEPFYTTRIGRGGTGLGLSVAHGVVTDHGGYLSIESTPGQGTMVLISLPTYEGEAELVAV